MSREPLRSKKYRSVICRENRYVQKNTALWLVEIIVTYKEYRSMIGREENCDLPSPVGTYTPHDRCSNSTQSLPSVPPSVWGLTSSPWPDLSHWWSFLVPPIVSVAWPWQVASSHFLSGLGSLLSDTRNTNGNLEQILLSISVFFTEWFLK